MLPEMDRKGNTPLEEQIRRSNRFIQPYCCTNCTMYCLFKVVWSTAMLYRNIVIMYTYRGCCGFGGFAWSFWFEGELEVGLQTSCRWRNGGEERVGTAAVGIYTASLQSLRGTAVNCKVQQQCCVVVGRKGPQRINQSYTRTSILLV